MEQNGSNQNMPSHTLCTRGCGFYGNSAFDGMCSKCYKDTVKRRQHNPAPSGLMGTTSLTSSLERESSGTQTPKINNDSAVAETSTSTDTNTTPSVETASPTVPSVATVVTEKEETEASSLSTTDSATVATAEASGRESPADKDKKPKKNRCHTCKKKVGLTGFQCRCGGLYCGLHRYSDKHECSFDYKEMAQEQIRKANPVVVGQKVQKI